jgi:uncharacterized membrane protein
MANITRNYNKIQVISIIGGGILFGVVVYILFFVLLSKFLGNRRR